MKALRLWLSFFVVFGASIQYVHCQEVIQNVEPAPQQIPQQKRTFHQWMNDHKLCCDAHFDRIGTGNFHSEMTFIFGSSRTFFGEPCFPKPQHAAPARESASRFRLWGRSSSDNKTCEQCQQKAPMAD